MKTLLTALAVTATLALPAAAQDRISLMLDWFVNPDHHGPIILAQELGYFKFELNQLALEGMEKRCFFPEAEGVPSCDELIYIANPDRMDAVQIARFLHATERATGFFLNSPDQAWQIFAATASELQTEVNARARADTSPRFDARPAALDAGRYTRFEAFLAAGGVTTGGLAVEALALDVTAQ